MWGKHASLRATFHFAESFDERGDKSAFEMRHSFLYFFSLVRISEFVYANFSSTCVRCSFAQKLARPLILYRLSNIYSSRRNVHQHFGPPAHCLGCRYQAFRPAVVPFVEFSVCGWTLKHKTDNECWLDYTGERGERREEGGDGGGEKGGWTPLQNKQRNAGWTVLGDRVGRRDQGEDRNRRGDVCYKFYQWETEGMLFYALFVKFRCEGRVGVGVLGDDWGLAAGRGGEGGGGARDDWAHLAFFYYFILKVFRLEDEHFDCLEWVKNRKLVIVNKFVWSVCGR